MKLTLNATRVPFHDTGIYRYTKILINSLHGLGVDLHVIRSNKHLNPSLNSEVTYEDIPKWLYNLRQSKLFPVYWYLYALFANTPKEIPIISATQHLFPFRRNQIISILDMRPYHAPDTILQRIYAKILFPLSLKNIMAVITISEASKEEISHLYGIDKRIIHVVYLYSDTKNLSPSIQLPKKPYLLMIGASFRHKNLHLAIIHHNAWSSKYKLIILSAENSYTRDMIQLAETSGISSSIEFKSMVSDVEKEGLLKEASALLYISSMEGFGIPPLEAMGYGTPCLLSNIPVFYELYSESAIFFDPHSPEGWSAAMSELADPYKVKAIVAAGYNRAGYFNPTRTENMLTSAIQSIFFSDIAE